MLPGNHAFYTKTLGMRLVKKTVNQDDVSAYHLFYADALASPGSDFTFFDWPVGRERRGYSITRTALRVAGEGTLAWWKRRFEQERKHSDIVERDTGLVLDFETSKASVSVWWTMAVPGRRILGTAARFRPNIRSGPWPDHHERARSGADRSGSAAVLNMEQVREYRTPDTADSRTCLPDGAGRSGC